MAEVLLPTWIIPERESHEWLDEGSVPFRAAFAPGLAQRQSFGGLRLKLSRQHTVRGEEKAQLLSILKATKGSYNVLRTKVHFALRGSFPTTEALTNGTFASGTTGWSAGATAALSSADRTLRISRTAAGAATSYASQTPSVTQYGAYVARVYANALRGESAVGVTLSGTNISTQTGSSPGLYSVTAAPLASNATFYIENTVANGAIVGDYFESRYTSLSRCAQVDNAPNALLRSDEIDNASWNKNNVTVLTDNNNSFDGNATADAIQETTANDTHYVSQSITVSSPAADLFLGAIVAPGSGGGARSFAYLQMAENTGSTVLRQFFDLSTGALGATSVVGANWSDLRTGMLSMGNGYYFCWIIGRKTNAATSITDFVGAASADGTISYTGVASGYALVIARAAAGSSSFATRLASTSGSASSGTSQTGDGLFVKGLPASTSGLLLPGDWAEIGGELKQLSSALNSDAAGRGFLQFEPSLVRSPSDGDAVVIAEPMGKFLVSNINIENEFGTQAIVTYDLEHIYE